MLTAVLKLSNPSIKHYYSTGMDKGKGNLDYEEGK